MLETDLTTTDGRILHAYDVGPTGRSDELVLLWHLMRKPYAAEEAT